MPVQEHETLVQVGAADTAPRQMVGVGNRKHLCIVITVGMAMICILLVIVAAELSKDPELHVQRVGVTSLYMLAVVLSVCGICDALAGT